MHTHKATPYDRSPEYQDFLLTEQECDPAEKMKIAVTKMGPLLKVGQPLYNLLMFDSFLE
ncbi:hypothetical protein AZI87_03890 [Bdellovibrio bacteriovorus]|uniref:Uncharacterized protein n=1 Tax=Bdellovibrio bacteriovorus TaxID=959 RepID=A0A162GKT8_BDEBC|nr:hypothetical protein AZI87_03890 [Bdellovibrio bacteriovorus]